MDLRPLLQNKWLLLLALLGAALMIFSPWLEGGGAPSAPTTAAVANSAATPSGQQLGIAQNLAGRESSTLAYENMLDQKLQAVLNNLSGVNDVSVMVTLDSTESLKLATNTKETRQTQGSRQGSDAQSTTVDDEIFTERNADGSSVPVVVQTAAPKVRGVLVLVNADDFFVAKAEIIDAIQHVLDVPAYKISVEPKKS